MLKCTPRVISVMDIKGFFSSAGSSSMTELDKVEFLLFYSQKREKVLELDIPAISNRLHGLGYSRPNPSRLRNNLRKSRRIVQGSTSDYYRLHKTVVIEFDAKYSYLGEKCCFSFYSSNSTFPRTHMKIPADLSQSWQFKSTYRTIKR